MNIEEMLKAQEEKINKIYTSVEKTRKYFLVTMIVTLVLFVLPLIGLIFIVPSFLSSYSTSLQEIGY